jgi:MinD superfamily P-loop ATPase
VLNWERKEELVMNIAISSGKGGTGKTFIATNLSVLLAERKQPVTYIDCDVEEPNGHLFLKPSIDKIEPMTIRAPIDVDPSRCIACGRCADNCHYNAMVLIKEKVLMFPELCHACGACSVACPTGAIIEGDKEIGQIRHGNSGRIAFHDGLLKTAVGGMSPRLIGALKEHADGGTVILDSPPGTACPTVETIKGVDLCLLVADPTPFALHDLKLSVNMCRQIGQEPAVVINRTGLDDTDLKDYCRKAQLEVVGEMPDAREIAEVYSVGDMVIEKLPQYRSYFEGILDRSVALAAEQRLVRKDLTEPLFTPGGKRARATRPNPDAQRPQEIVVISGKGGTGKTSLAACFAQLATEAAVSDCDVDAADLHLILDPTVLEEGDFVGGIAVNIDQAKCSRCGTCKAQCRFKAIELKEDGSYLINSNSCEGCGVCAIVCKDNAIDIADDVNGKWFVSKTRFGSMSHAILGYAEENSGRLVTLVRDMASNLVAESLAGRDDSAHVTGSGQVIIDGSPGTGCPVIASITGARYAVVVTEPTVSGLHDLERILQLTQHFGVETGVIINKADLNRDMAQNISEAARQAGAGTLGSIPYEKAFTKAQIQKKTVLEYGASKAADVIVAIWEKIEDKLA